MIILSLCLTSEFPKNKETLGFENHLKLRTLNIIYCCEKCMFSFQYHLLLGDYSEINISHTNVALYAKFIPLWVINHLKLI